jgi:thiosulfate/3-mercaptopyruvate sulfurtransferase
VAPLNPLVTTQWLGDNLYADDLRVVDCRFYLAEPDQGRREYDEGHLPTAIYLSLDDDLTGATGPGRHPLPAVAEFVATLRRVGIGNQHRVVAYDDRDGAIAARLWWMFRSLGHTAVSVLDGGYAAWAAEPRSVTTEVPRFPPAGYEAPENWSGTIDRKAIAAGDMSLLLVDAREAARYRGDEEPIDPVAGHIPGAINLPYEENVLPSGHFRPVAELAKRFPAADAASTLVSYCGSGVTACHNLLALELAGHTGALLYPGSWSDWCTTGGPVATQTSQ